MKMTAVSVAWRAEKRKHEPRKNAHDFPTTNVDRRSHSPSTIRRLVYLHREPTRPLGDPVPTRLITAAPLYTFSPLRASSTPVCTWFAHQIALHHLMRFLQLEREQPLSRDINTLVPSRSIRMHPHFHTQTWLRHPLFQYTRCRLLLGNGSQAGLCTFRDNYIRRVRRCAIPRCQEFRVSRRQASAIHRRTRGNRPRNTGTCWHLLTAVWPRRLSH